MSEPRKLLSRGKQGVAGPPGDDGAPGDPASVTAANVLTAAEAMTAEQEAAMRAALGLSGAPINVKDYGAVGDATMVHDAVLNGTTTVTSATAGFTGATGKYVRIPGGTVAGTRQVATFTAAGNITAAGTIIFSLTAANVAGTDGVSGSVLGNITLAVLLGDTPTQWAGRLRALLPTLPPVAELYDVGGSTTAVTLTCKRSKANDATLLLTRTGGTATADASLAISSTITTAGVARVDLITSIASVTNATTAVLANAAAISGSGKTLFFGTNDTVAVQDAYDEALSSGRSLYFPAGNYLCNIDGGQGHDVHIFGVGGIGSLIQDTIKAQAGLGTVRLSTLMPAVASEPVLKFAASFGLKVERLLFLGSNEKLGYGVQIGDPRPEGGSYCGANDVFEQVGFVGFEYGSSLSRVTEVTFTACNWVQNRIQFFGGEHGGSVGPADGIVFNGCAMTGADVDYDAFFGAECKQIVINSGDWIQAKHVAYLNASSVTVNGLNSEAITGVPWQLYGSTLKINSCKILDLVAPMIDTYGSTDVVEVSDTLKVSASGAGLWEGVPIVLRTSQYNTPSQLPRGYVVQRFAAGDWVRLMRTDWTSRMYESADNQRRQAFIKDDFVSRLGASPYSEAGWLLTQFVGTTLLGRHNYPNNSNSLGLFETTCSNQASTNEFRMGFPVGIFTATNAYFEMRWTLEFPAPAVDKRRWGLYSCDATLNQTTGAISSGTLDLEPLYGIGFHFVGGTDTNVFAEVINNGVVTRIDTGFPVASMNSRRECIIIRNAQGLFFLIQGNEVQGSSTLVPMLKHTQPAPSGAELAPAMYSGVISASYQITRHARFSLEQFQI